MITLDLGEDLQKFRDARRHEIDDDERDPRTEAQRDRDRILYSSAFRRLDGVTQVVSATEGLVVHNRLTHTLKVAQVARRIAERILRNPEQKALAAELGGLDPDVVEAAGLAHDLGHPPFGHIAEEELDAAVTDSHATGPDQDGFEGNAQSFRVVTRQSLRSRIAPGLNLTRATLNAILKYPWYRDPSDKKRNKKWGAYKQEEVDFTFAREGVFDRLHTKSVEAEIMDWADDIAYALHDVEDFYRAGLVPLDRLVSDRDEKARFFDGVFARNEIDDRQDQVHYEEAFDKVLIPKLTATGPFNGSSEQRINLKKFISSKIGYYAGAISLQTPTATDPETVHVHEARLREIFMLKQITWHYVIVNPALASKQHGQRKIIRTLYTEFRHDATKKGASLFPIAFRDRLVQTRKDLPNDETAITRLVVDLIASMTEDQALVIYRKLTGFDPGSGIDGHLHVSLA